MKRNLMDLKSLKDFNPGLLIPQGRGRTRSRWAFANPVAPNMIDIENQPIYDTNSLAAGAAFPQQLTFFQTPKGQAGKTYLQTNMVNPSSLPAPQTLSIRAYRLIVRNDATPQDLINFLYDTYLDFWIGSPVNGPDFLGNGQNPHPMLPMYRFAKNHVITFQLTDTSGAANTIGISLEGRKLLNGQS